MEQRKFVFENLNDVRDEPARPDQAQSNQAIALFGELFMRKFKIHEFLFHTLYENWLQSCIKF